MPPPPTLNSLNPDLNQYKTSKNRLAVYKILADVHTETNLSVTVVYEINKSERVESWLTRMGLILSNPEKYNPIYFKNINTVFQLV